MARRPRGAHALTAAAVLLALVAGTATAGASSRHATPAVLGAVTEGCLRSVPGPETPQTPQRICYSLFRPAGATSRHRVPLVMHGHPWSFSRIRDWRQVEGWLADGFGVLSFDQRGFGESQGVTYWMNPDVEGHDLLALVDLVAHLPWVQQDGPGDPRLGAVGASYGGGYQWLAAFSELRRRGKPVFDALAPDITWWDARDAMAPQRVVRTGWVTTLSRGAQGSLSSTWQRGFTEATALGAWPDGSNGTEDLEGFFAHNGPAWQVASGLRLDIPVLIRQGINDSLFPLEHGFAAWQRALTPAARSRSMLVGFLGGHVNPGVLPGGSTDYGDPCSRLLAGSFEQLERRFMRVVLKHERLPLPGLGQLHLARDAGHCVTVGATGPTTSVPVGDVQLPQGAGPQVAVRLADGPLSLAGTAALRARVSGTGLVNRAFLGLGIGPDPQHVAPNHALELPLNVAGPVTGAPLALPLPSIVREVPRGQSLYLVANAVDDAFLGFSSRAPGLLLLQDVRVDLPVRRGSSTPSRPAHPERRQRAVRDPA